MLDGVGDLTASDPERAGMVLFALSRTVGGIDKAEAEEHAFDNGAAQSGYGEGQDKGAVAAWIDKGRYAGQARAIVIEGHGKLHDGEKGVHVGRPVEWSNARQTRSPMR